MSVRFSKVPFRAVGYCHVCRFAPLIQKSVHNSLFLMTSVAVRNTVDNHWLTCHYIVSRLSAQSPSLSSISNSTRPSQIVRILLYLYLQSLSVSVGPFHDHIAGTCDDRAKWPLLGSGKVNCITNRRIRRSLYPFYYCTALVVLCVVHHALFRKHTN